METLSANNKKIKQLQAYQRSAKDRREDGIFLTEGVKMYREAPASWIKEVYLTPKRLEELGEPEVPFYLVDEELFPKISDTQTPQGVLTVLRRPAYSLMDLLPPGKTPLLLVLENLQDPGNLGTILRVGEAAGVTGFLLSKGCVDIFNPKVVRATMGSVYRMRYAITEDLQGDLLHLKEMGVHTYGAHLQGSSVYTEYDYRQPTAFFIGNEGNGLTEETTVLAEHRLLIPMEGEVESLNAGVAAAILVYEAHRQRIL